MGVLTADATIVAYGRPTVIALKNEIADTYYQGSLVWSDAAGEANALPASGDSFYGICLKGTGALAANDEFEVAVKGLFEVPMATGLTAADEGNLLYCDAGTAGSLTDNFLDMDSSDDLTLGTTDIVIGRILRVKASDSRMVIYIDPAMSGDMCASTATNLWK